ncbi:MAG: peptidase MA family metallohydrolase [bacterium]
MKNRIRPRFVLLILALALGLFAIAYLSYIQQYNQSTYRLNAEAEMTARLVYEMVREQGEGKMIKRLTEYEEFIHYETKNFNIYCHNPELAYYLAQNMEGVFERITQRMGFTSADLEYRAKEKTTIVIFKDIDQYKNRTDSPFPWSIGNAVYITNSFFSYEGPHLQGLIPHEMTHLLFYRFLKSRYDRGTMRWLSEGIAVYGEESAHDKFVKEVLRPKLKFKKAGSFIPIKELIQAKDLHKKDLGRVHLWYAECLSIVEFLIEAEGKEKLKEFALVLADTRKVNYALETVYGENFGDINTLQEKWLAHIKSSKPTQSREDL